MSKDNTTHEYWRMPRPGRIVFGSLGIGKTYTVPPTNENRTTSKEEKGRE